MNPFAIDLTRLDVSGWLTNGLVVAVTAAVVAVLARRRLRTSERWQATVTPLASIIGSGFLVVAPLLAFTVGVFAAFAMAGLVAIAYLVGGAIRYNIRHVEDEVEDGAEGAVLHWMERLAKVALALAYVIAVTFYLELLGAFVMRGAGIDEPTYQKGIATGILVMVAVVGRWRGLRMLERMETISVDTKLAIIAGLLAGLLVHNVTLAASGEWALPVTPVTWDTRTVRMLLGAFLIVQGFETSRYLRGAYDQDVRVRTMRYAQWIAAAIYVAFVGLATVLFDVFDTISETRIIEMSDRVALVLPMLLIVGAVMSQFSAAVADTVGSGGLVSEATAGKVSERNTYVVVAALATGLLWLTDIFSVIAWASRAFAAYYAIQTAMAALHAGRTGSPARAAGYGALCLLMVATAIFGIPAEAAGGGHR